MAVQRHIFNRIEGRYVMSGSDPAAVCPECDWIDQERTGKCPHCKTPMRAFASLAEGEKPAVRAQVWFRALRTKGLHGFSPGGAANRLGCHRSMIDKLVGMGVLEKSEYDRDGIKMIFISERSVKRAMQAKKESGKWTGLAKEGE